MFRVRPSPSCDSESVKIQFHWPVEKTDEDIWPVDCRVFHVCTRKFMCLLERLFKDTVFRWQASPLASYQWFRDHIFLNGGRTGYYCPKHSLVISNIKIVASNANLREVRPVENFKYMKTGLLSFLQMSTHKPDTADCAKRKEIPKSTRVPQSAVEYNSWKGTEKDVTTSTSC